MYAAGVATPRKRGPHKKRGPKKGTGKIRLTKEQIAMIPGLAASGVTQDTIADIFGICANTLRKIFAEHPKIGEAYRSGRGAVKAKCERALQANIEAGKEGSLFLFLKTQCAGYKDVSTIEHGVTAEAAQTFAELAKRARD